MKTESNDPIYPCEVGYEKGKQIAARQISNTTALVIGLTKREYFAAMAMQGLLTDIRLNDAKVVSFHAVKFADALIKELNNHE